MPRLTKIYTRTGDDGTTALATGERVSKSAPRVAAYGAVDELNAQLGVVLAAGPASELIKPLRLIQSELLIAGAELSSSVGGRKKPSGPRIEPSRVENLEELIDRLSAALPPLAKFVLPGGDLAAAHLHAARTICRRAERLAISLGKEEPIGEHLVPYLNRLSDALFVMARYQNKHAGVDEPLWDSPA